MLKTVSSDIDQTDLLIESCKQLAELGVDQSVVNGAIAQLQEERLVVCPECAAEVRSRDLELHLRRAHEVFQFRGARHTYVDIREVVLKAICTPPADLAADGGRAAASLSRRPWTRR